MIKQLTHKDIKVLIKRYSLKESQFNYEYKRSIKKGISIKEWLNNKYNKVSEPVIKVSEPVILYHFTNRNCIKQVLKWGIVFGDVVSTSNGLEGFNAPNLTAQNHYHIPADTPEHYIKKGGYWRLTVRLEPDDSKLVNYQDFYTSRNMTTGIADPKQYEKRGWGTLSQQYFYKGHIDKSKIIAISQYDYRTQKWKRVNEKEIDNYLLATPEPIAKKSKIKFCRICGFQFNDTTGMVSKINQELDKSDPRSCVNKYSDVVVKKLIGTKLKKYKLKLFDYFCSEKIKGDLLEIILPEYNKLVSRKERVDISETIIKCNDYERESRKLLERKVA